MKRAKNPDKLFELTNCHEIHVMKDLEQYFEGMFFAN